MVDPAELRALSEEHAGPLRREPGGVDPAGDRVDLAAEGRDPPGVDDVPVRRRDLQFHGAPLGRSQPVDRDDPVRIAVLPGELRAGHLDNEILVARGRGRDVLDLRELREHERRDREQDHHRPDRPGELEAVRAVDLGAVGITRPVAAAIAHDEQDKQHLDEQEDPEDERRDEPPALADAVGVRGLRRDRREAAVTRERRGCAREQHDERADDGDDVPPEAHGAGIL